MRIFNRLIIALAAMIVSYSLSSQDIKNANGYVQLYHVNSKLAKTSEKYVFENDSIKVTYYFWGSRGIMQISIFNKIDAPIFIDWKKSFMQNNIDNKLIYSYETEMNAQNSKLYKMYVHEGRNLSSIDYEGNYQMGIVEEKKIETITEIKSKGFYMSLRYNLLPREIYKFEPGSKFVSEVRNDDGRITTEVYETEFDDQSSPLKFNSTLAYSTSKDFATISTISNDFWVSKIREMDAKHFMGEKTGKTPEGFPIYKFPFRKSTSFYIEIDKKNSVFYKNTKK